MHDIDDVNKIFLGPLSAYAMYSSNNYNNSEQDTPSSTHSGKSIVDYANFDEWIKEYNTVQENQETKGPAFTFRELREQFDLEKEILVKLYVPIKSVADACLETDFSHRGSTMYYNWGRARGKEHLMAYYDNIYFRAEYAKNRFFNAATSFIQALCMYIIPHIPSVESYLANISTVISIGVGPGSDIAAMVAFLRSRNYNQQLLYLTMDQCADWSVYIEECHKHWSRSSNVSIWFKQSRISTVESVTNLPNADIIVFSFANTSIMELAIWNELKSRYKFILILDGNRIRLIEEFCDNAFHYFQLNDKTSVYFYFRPDYGADDQAAVKN